MGLGGGMVLIVYLTVIEGSSQITAQGINLMFFVPIAMMSLILHTRNGLVEWKEAVPAIIWGAASAALFSILANKMDQDILSKAFAVFLIIAGIKELFSSKGKTADDKQ